MIIEKATLGLFKGKVRAFYVHFLMDQLMVVECYSIDLVYASELCFIN